jgi:hypothetical protein
MTGIPTGMTFPGIEDISAFEFVFGRGIEPGACIVECLPQDSLSAAAGDLQITYDTDLITFADMAPVEQWLQQASYDPEDKDGPGFRMYVKLLDHRRRWKGGTITGQYNIRLTDGSVYSATKKEPSELASLCLTAMGESGFDVSEMPNGVYPPILWDAVNPAQALDHLCRYIGCEITGGERAQVKIVQVGSGDALSEGGEHINEPFVFTPSDSPSSLQVQGGKTVWQAKLKLTPHVVQSGVASTLSTAWEQESPFSLPGITAAELRQAAFESQFHQFPVTSLADGSNNLPLAPFPITKPHQYILQDYRLDTFTDLQLAPQNLPARVEGKFFPYGDDADSHTTIQPYTGRFLIRRAGNIVEFGYPVWKTSSTGLMEKPELYLLTSFYLQSVDGDDYAKFTAERSLGGSGTAKVLKRPELFFSVKVNYGDDGTTTAGNTSTQAAALAEAEKYLDIFAAIAAQEQVDVEWLEIKDIRCTGKIAQVRHRGSVRPGEGFTTRASSGFEFDIYGPTNTDGRITREVLSKLERANP